ncbi:MAG: PAS domain S-box protein [Gammaproteobacteria bacterium]|nr:PAS domain S-box protein [Gammaproteobacteria bacterium]
MSKKRTKPEHETHDADRDRYRMVAEWASDGILGIDTQSTILFANPAVQRIFGYTSDELIGQKLTMLMPQEFRSRHKRSLGAYVINGKKNLNWERVELPGLHKSGKMIVLEISFGEFVDDGARNFVGVIRDITERKQAEDVLKKSEIHLKKSRDQLRALAAYMHTIAENERVSLARDIHDEIGAALASLKMGVSLLGRRISGSTLAQGKQADFGSVRSMNARIDATMNAVRNVIHRLRPPVIDDFGLVASLEWQLEELRERTGLECQLSLDGVVLEIDDACKIAVFRIFQEALTNITRHANARKVFVTIDEEEDIVTLSIRDDGVGIAPKRLEATGTFGLVGMKERALMFDGQVEIDSSPGAGTTVRIRIPVP